MDAWDDFLMECERDSFFEAAKVAKQHKTKLILSVDGKQAALDPDEVDLSKLERISVDHRS